MLDEIHSGSELGKHKDMIFYGEWVEYNSPEEKDEAIVYLNSWKKFILKKIKKYELICEHPLIERNYTENMYGERFPINTLAIKLELKLKPSEACPSSSSPDSQS